MGIEQLHYEHLDSFIFAGLTWEEYKALPVTYHASRPTWWRRKRALIAQGEPIKMDRELLKGAEPMVGKHTRRAPSLATNNSDLRDVGYESYLLNAVKVLPNRYFPYVRPPTIDLTQAGDKICIVPILDRQLVRWATDLPTLVQITCDVMRTPNLYLCVLGDAGDLLAKLHDKFARYDKDASGHPKPEHTLLDAWLSWLAPRILFVTSRDSTAKEGKAQDIFAGLGDGAHWRVITYDPLASANIRVGIQEYHLAVSQLLRGYTLRSALYKVAGALWQTPTAPEIILLEGTRATGALSYSMGGPGRIIMACGKELELRRGMMGLPCFTLDGSSHNFVTFPSVRSCIEASSKS